jgi:aminopeptidase N
VDALRSLTRDEARARAEIVVVDRYDIAVDLTDLAEGDAFRATSTVRFSCRTPGAATFVDCAAEVVRATLNGAELPTDAVGDARIALSDLAADNVLVVESVQRQTHEATGVHRSVDAADKQVYVWTSFEPDEARRAWACFDQPDLKAVHAFTVTAPETWTVLSNTGDAEVEEVDAGRRWAFGDTPRLSTYVPVVNAGPFHERRAERDGRALGLYCRQSLASYLDRDADELFDITAAGLAFFGEQFAMPFPQRRYDQVFVPDLGGAMENYGCVTWSDASIFRNAPTHGQREERAAILLHEMAHMWFGDIVTMRWWDDLWLNEAFAEWAANWATAAATEFTDKWAGFLTGAKLAGYRADRAPTSHPIRQEVGDVADAAAGFDDITYWKGASVLKQLVAYVGEDTFVAGLRTYFAKHAWGNASLDDLVAELAAASGRDLSSWVAGWLETAGTDELSLERAGDGYVLHAEGPAGGEPRPHRLDVGVYDRVGDGLVRRELVAVHLEGRSAALSPGGGPPDLLLLNDEDLTFAGVRPDEDSLSALVTSAALLPRAISRAVAVQTVWDALVVCAVTAADFVTCATAVLRRETAEAVVEPFLRLAVQAAEHWSPPAVRDQLLETVADTCLMLAQADGPRRHAAVRGLARTATTDEQLVALRELAGDDSDLRWRALTRQAALGRLDRDELDALKAQDPDPDAWVRALAAEAAQPDVQAKTAAWQAGMLDRKVPMGSLGELATAFWQPGQAEVLAPFVDRYVEVLPDLSRAGMLLAMATSAFMFPVVGVDVAGLLRAQVAARSDDVSPLVRRTVEERADQVRRMLAARAG